MGIIKKYFLSNSVALRCFSLSQSELRNDQREFFFLEKLCENSQEEFSSLKGEIRQIKNRNELRRRKVHAISVQNQVAEDRYK